MGATSILTYANYLALFLGFLASAHFVLSRPSKGREAYEDMDHLALNCRRPETEWLNMGDWANTDDFPTACENLARRLQKAANIPRGASILEVGHGAGDSLLLLAKEKAPRILHGVTSLRSHADRASERLQRHMSLVGSSTESKIWCGDAMEWLRTCSSPTTSISTDGALPKYDFILALDCAYHFKTREEFFKLCFARLSPGGTLALSDLFASFPYPNPSSSSIKSNFKPAPLPPPQSSPSFTSLMKNRLILKLSGVPSHNIIPFEEHSAQLHTIGFREIQVEDISQDMFVGFSKFLKGLGKGEERNWRGGGVIQLYGLRSFGEVVEGWSRGGENGRIRSGIVVARKP